ncbi:hypothetical protein L861_18070 [Litchfieldella anticariensis FP35 = DSM 16096]|uniref:Uncharacterized protein n=1 Tax=Litchfieldella anticariensis (strain DSM 16096 / CECT 5854 / CIP 108499 / LMG 22089 / FP35) TaxID=1121939 RepID=S2KNF5_LITA3|nr:hypothetical protein L861_18070 [Halomonas anticariensis FP35 = DSM 16096]
MVFIALAVCPILPGWKVWTRTMRIFESMVGIETAVAEAS